MGAPRSMPSDGRPAIAITALAVTLLIYFWRLWGGAVFLPTDMIFDFPFFRQSAPDGFLRASNALLSDVVLKFHPWRIAVADALRQGHLPFWNPFIFCGAPLLANGESAVFYPLNLLTQGLSPERAVAVTAILRLALAGVGMFAFLRALRLAVPAALLGALTFMLSGSNIVWLHYPISNVYVCLPLVCWTIERWILTQRPLYLSILATVIGMQVLGGHPQTSFIVVLVPSCYAAYRVRQGACERWQLGGALAAAMSLGILIAAIHLIPFLYWLGDTAEWQLRTQERADALYYRDWWKGGLSAPILFLLPNFFGHPRWWLESFFFSNYIELTVYVGIVPLVFAVVAIHQTLRSSSETAVPAPPARFFAVLAIISLALALRVPGVDLINHLPLLEVLPPGRYRLVLTLALSVLAAIGFDRFLRDEQRAWLLPRIRRVAIAALVLQIGLLLSAYFTLTLFESTLARFNRIQRAYPVLLQVFQPGYWGMYFSAAATLALLAAVSARITLTRRGAMVFVLVIVTAIDLYCFGSDFNPVIAPDAVFPRTPAADFLAAHVATSAPERIVALEDDLPPNTGMPYRLQEIAGSDFPSARYLTLMESFGAQVLSGHNRVRFTNVPQRLLDLANVRFLIASGASANASERPWRPVYSDPHVAIFENPSALPRVSMVHRATTLSDSAALLERLQSPLFDPRVELLLEDAVPPLPAESTRAETESVGLRRYEANRVSIVAELSAPGWVYLADAYAPGWRAEVDGREHRLYRANYAFRAIHLPAGKHAIELSYTAPGFALGLGLSALGLMVVAGGLVVRKRDAHRHG